MEGDFVMRFLIIFVICAIGYGIFQIIGRKSQNNLKNKLMELKKEVGSDYYSYYGGCLSLKKQHPRMAEYITLKAYNPSLYSTTPKRLVYTSATVGGITTGGFHTVGGDTVNISVSTDRIEMKFYDIFIYMDEVEWKQGELERIDLTAELYEKAKKSKVSKYLDEKRKCIIVKEENKASYAAALLYRAGNTEASVNQFTMDNIDTYPDAEKCNAIMEFICGVENESSKNNKS